MSENSYDIGMIGLGTMGHSLLLNMADKGHRAAGFDTDPKKVASLNGGDERLRGFSDIAEFVKSIRKPRALIVLVPAGGPVDSVIASLRPHLEPGDFVIDAGNSYYKDTNRRIAELSSTGIGFMGMGISGGESGARHGPSMMPGGSQKDFERVQPILEGVAAKYQGEPCVALMGSGSAGHYVKMVHNGIEYAIMQLIAEVYDLLHRGHGLSNPEIADLFADWDKDSLQGFLVEITSTVLRYKDEKTGQDLVDLISDKAKSKGTGKWTSQDAMDLGIPIPTIDAAVSARELSGYKPLREEAATKLTVGFPQPAFEVAMPAIKGALELAALVSYAQGLAQIQAASEEYSLGVDLTTVAKVWRAGCIIRSSKLEQIRAAFSRTPQLANLLLDPQISGQVANDVAHLRQVVIAAHAAAIPVPALSASLSYIDGLRTSRLPANLIQAQRDLFGAHTYERLDQPGSFHTEWEPE